MTQVIQHDYGKSKVSLLQIRAAIKAVKADKSVSILPEAKPKIVATRKSESLPSRKSRKRA